MNVAKIIKLKEQERIITVVRNHWLVSLGGWIAAFLFVAAAFFLMLPLFKAGWQGLAGFALLNGIGLFVAARTFVAWHWNAFIITSVRVVDVGQKGFFDRTVSEATYENIQNVSYKVQGVIGTLFRFGTIEIQTASNAVTLALEAPANPKDVHHLITECIARHKGTSSGSSPSAEAPRDAKVASLLETAASLDDVETRALLTSLQARMNEKGAQATRAKKDDADDESLEFLRRES